MVDANELRIGNLLYFKNTKDLQRVELIHKKHFDCRGVEFGDFTINGEYEPIHLTEEILLKCGWVWNEECNSYEKHPNGDTRLNVTSASEISGKRVVFNYVLKSRIADVFYLHQLQNLYFALTGKELEINL